MGRTYEILAAGEAGWELELVRHVVRLHDFARPLSSFGVEFIDLEPAAAYTRVGRCIVDGLEEVCDRAWVAGVVPLDFDAVACFGVDGHDGGTRGARHIAGHVIAGYILDGGVAWWHPDADLVAWGGIIDPELMEVLVGGGSSHEGCSKKSLGEHFDWSLEKSWLRRVGLK